MEQYSMSPDDHSASAEHEVIYHLVFLYGIYGRPLDAAIIERRANHLAQLDRSGKLVLAGPIVGRNSGVMVLRVANRDEAEAIAQDDPLVRNGYQSYELATWRIADQVNRYRPNLEGTMTQ